MEIHCGNGSGKGNRYCAGSSEPLTRGESGQFTLSRRSLPGKTNYDVAEKHHRGMIAVTGLFNVAGFFQAPGGESRIHQERQG